MSKFKVGDKVLIKGKGLGEITQCNNSGCWAVAKIDGASVICHEDSCTRVIILDSEGEEHE